MTVCRGGVGDCLRVWVWLASCRLPRWWRVSGWVSAAMACRGGACGVWTVNGFRVLGLRREWVWWVRCGAGVAASSWWSQGVGVMCRVATGSLRVSLAAPWCKRCGCAAGRCVGVGAEGRVVWWCGCWGGPVDDRGSHSRIRGSQKRVGLGVHAGGCCGMCPVSPCAVPMSVAIVGVAVDKHHQYGGSSAIWWSGCHDRILGSHTLPCHKRVVITTLFSGMTGGGGVCQRALHLLWLLGRLAGPVRLGWVPLVDRPRCWRPRPLASASSSLGRSLSNSSCSCGSGGGRWMVRCAEGGLYGLGLGLKASRGDRSRTLTRRLVYARDAPGLFGVGRCSYCGQAQAAGAAP